MQLTKKNYFIIRPQTQKLIIQHWIWICRFCYKGLFEERMPLCTVNNTIIVEIRRLSTYLRNSDYNDYKCPQCGNILSLPVMNLVPGINNLFKTKIEELSLIDQIIYFKTKYACFDKKKMLLAMWEHPQPTIN